MNELNYDTLMKKKAKERIPFSGAPRLTHPDGQWLSELPESVQKTTGIRVGDFIVNPNTGEILGEYSVHKVEPPSAEEKAYLNSVVMFPTEARHVEQVKQWLAYAVDGRRIVKFNDCKKIHDALCGEAKRNGTPTALSVPEYTKLNNLCNELLIMNFIIGDSKVVASKIKVKDHRNIRRDYASLVEKGLVKVETSKDGLMKGQAKISVHPYFAYVHEKGVFTSSRANCLSKWIKKETQPLLTKEFLDSLPPPAPYEDGILYDDSKYVSLYLEQK